MPLETAIIDVFGPFRPLRFEMLPEQVHVGLSPRLLTQVHLGDVEAAVAELLLVRALRSRSRGEPPGSLSRRPPWPAALVNGDLALRIQVIVQSRDLSAVRAC